MADITWLSFNCGKHQQGANGSVHIDFAILEHQQVRPRLGSRVCP